MTLHRRVLTTALLAFGVALGSPALASAGAFFDSHGAFAGPTGSGITVTRSVANDDGSVGFVHYTYIAGPQGATVTTVESFAD